MKNPNMKTVKVLPLVLASLLLTSCGGGGGNEGTSVFGTGNGTTTGTGGTGTVSGGTTGTPITSAGGITTVSTGVPSQRFMSISSEKYNLDWGLDGDTTTVQVFIADTAGNPVPDGSVIQFSTEGGQIETSCRTTGFKTGSATISGCSVTFNTQDFRPFDGTVTIVAWMDGEEAYRDVNGNGKYDSGEPFIDSGRVFRDDDNSQSETAADELVVDTTLTGAPGLGSLACEVAPASVNVNEVPLSVTNTCDGVWGKTLIRRTVTFPVSDPRFLQISNVASVGVRVSTFGYSAPVAAPAGTTVSALNAPVGCTVVISPATVGSTEIGPTTHKVVGTGTCSGQSVLVEAKFGSYSPVSTSYTFP